MMFDLEADEARLLLNIALMAVGSNRFKSAAKLFAVLERFRPDAPEIACANAVALMSALDFAGCVEYLDEVALKRFPSNPMLLAFKGMALIRLGRNADAAMPLSEAAAQSEDPAAAKLAGDLLADGVEE